LASGSEDRTVRLWEVATALCRKVWHLSSPVSHLSWNPHPQHAVLAAAVDNSVVLIGTGTGDVDTVEVTESLLAAALGIASSTSQRSEVNAPEPAEDDEDNDDGDDGSKADSDDEDGTASNNANKAPKPKHGQKAKAVAKWRLPNSVESNGTHINQAAVGVRVVLQLGGPLTHMAWHHKGDYLATVATAGKGAHEVAIHQLSKAKTQYPFSKSPGLVQAVSFHPTRPFIFVVTQQHVRIFHLVEQQLVKKLLTGCKWLSCIDVHPSGDHVILGSYDRRVVWFDLDLSSKPYKTLKFHEKAVRSVQFHR
jgi:ribosome biogenesis protein ERB1